MKSVVKPSPKWGGFALLLAFSLIFAGCKKSGPDDNLDYNRERMLATYGEHVILPQYRVLNDKLILLDSSATAFINNPDQASLARLRQALYESWLSWQDVNIYEIGPAEQVLLRAQINTWPVDTSRVGSNIRDGGYNLEAASNLDAKGFPALDYLLNDSVTGTPALVRFTGSPDAAARLNYLRDLIFDMKTLVQTVREGWEPSGGNYLATFKENTGTDVGSSTGLLVNQFNLSFEHLKNQRIGVPAGVKTAGIARPDQVECLYGGYSLALANQNLIAFKNAFWGTQGNGASSGSPYGLGNALDDLGATHGENSLSKVIVDQFGIALDEMITLNDPLSDFVQSNQAGVELVYTELQKLVVLLKTDMPSEMGVQITYQDNDGD